MVMLRTVIDALELKVYCCKDYADRPVLGGYCGDLLSDVMANARAGEIWITNQVHPNIADVASLKEMSAILLANGKTPYPDTMEKAEKERVPILGSRSTAFDLANRISQMIAAKKAAAK